VGEDFTLGAPQWETAPGMVGGDDGYREVSFTLAVDASYSTAASTMSAVARVLQARAGWLRLKRDSSVPQMFLRWYRTTPQPLDWERWQIDTYRLQVTLTCDPYLYGEPINLGPYTISNRPDTGTNRMFLDWTADTFVGDAPAPLQLTITPSTTMDGYQPLIATTALAPGQTQTQPYYWDLTAANWTAGTNVGGDVADSTYVGGSYRLWSVSGGGIGPRLTGSLSPAPPPGLYKVLVRVAMTANASTFNLHLTQTFSTTQTYSGDDAALVRPSTTITAYATWVDLGQFAFPYGGVANELADLVAANAQTVSIDAARLAGTSNLRFDALLLIPVETAAVTDTRISTWRFQGQGMATNRTGVWDGQRERFTGLSATSNRLNQRQPEPRGGWPRVTPGVVNALYLLQQTQVDTPFDTTASDNDVITDTCSVAVSYMPRYLHLRP